MLLVTHELGFAYHFATKVVFLAMPLRRGRDPRRGLESARGERTRSFLARHSEFAF